MNNKLKILITGPIAPPAGGISIHIQRLCYLLQDDFEMDLVDETGLQKPGIFNMRSLQLFTYLKKVKNADLLFVQSGNKLFKKIHIAMAKMFGKKLIITLHGYGPKRPQPFRYMDSCFFNLADRIILVNADIANRVSLAAKKIIVKHAFLPPVMENEPALPIAVSAFINKARTDNAHLVCANASRLDTHQGEDLYGLDMCVEIASRLIAKKIPLRFIYTVSSLESGDDRFQSNLSRIRELGIENEFLLINERLSFVKLVEQCDVVLRPTNTDGDALTVREALYLGKQVLASDVVERPEGTTLFKTRDVNDLEDKLTQILNGKVTRIKAGEGTRELKAFYTELIRSVALN